MKKRLLSLALAAAMVLGILPTAAFAAGTSYADVAATEWFYDAVSYVSQEGLMSGVGNNTFSPNTTLTRAQLCQILYNREGQPAGQAGSFTDVGPGDWFSGAVGWAAANHIVDGMGNGQFMPNNPVTREQMVTILYRYAGYKGYSLGGPADLDGFTDAGSLSSWARTQMEWAVGEGLINGTTATTISPQGTATRAQAAAILMRFCQRMDIKADFYAKDMDDFPGAEIINFDQSEQTNFAVLEEGTVVSESSGEVNQLVSADDEEGVYVFSNADRTLTGLKPGEVLYLTYGEGPDDYLLLKVGTIQAQDGTVTITEGEGELADFFQYIDLDMEVELTGEEDGTASVSGPAGPVVAAAAQSSLATENTAPGLVAKDLDAEGSVGLKFGVDSEEFKCTATVSASVEFKISYDKFILDITEISVIVKSETEVKLQVLANIAKKELLPSETPEIPVAVMPGLEMDFSASFKIDGSIAGTGTVTAKYSTENGVSWRDGEFYPVNESDADMTADLGGTFSIKPCFGVTGTAKALKVITLNLGGEAGVELKGVVTTPLHTSTKDEERHLCAACTDGTITASGEVTLSVKVGVSKKHSYTVAEWDPAEAELELAKFYISLLGQSEDLEFGWGKCPHKEYRVTVAVRDEDGQGLEDALVAVNYGEENTGAAEDGRTDEDGLFQCYCRNGEYNLTAALEGYETGEETATVDGKAVNVVLRLKAEEQPATRVTRTTALDLTDLPTQENAAEGWSWNRETLTLTLDNVSIITPDPFALRYGYGNDPVTVIVKGENTLQSTGKVVGDGESADRTIVTAGICCLSILELRGDGRLTAIGGESHVEEGGSTGIKTIFLNVVIPFNQLEKSPEYGTPRVI